MKTSHFSEGDYIRTIDGLFFSVKGGIHSDETVISVLRYIPDEKGDRIYDEKPYRRVYDLEFTTKYLQNYNPLYINYIDWLGLTLQAVPIEHIVEVYKPVECLKRILANPESKLEKNVAKFVNALSSKSRVSSSSFGVSGSLLIELDNVDSDIDLNVYGEQNGSRVYEALKELRENEEWISPYNKDSIKQILLSRWGNTGRLVSRGFCIRA